MACKTAGMKAALLAFKGLLAYGSGAGAPSILRLSNYAYKCHYLPIVTAFTSLVAITNMMAQGALIIYFV
jgi:hypothetical protein